MEKNEHVSRDEIEELCNRFYMEFWRLQRMWQIKVITDYSINTPRDMYISDFASDVKKLIENYFGKFLGLDNRESEVSDQ